MKPVHIFLIILIQLVCHLNGLSLKRKGHQSDSVKQQTSVKEKSICPKGFDEFENRCFHIRRMAGSQSVAVDYCKRQGGHAVWFSGEDDGEEEIATRYINAKLKAGTIYRSSPYVWLMGTLAYGRKFMWWPIEKDATKFMNKHHYYHKYAMIGRPSLYMSTSGDVLSCGHCRGLQAFCEVFTEARNSTALKPTGTKKPKPNRRKKVSSMTCPRWFIKYREHCFNISREKGSLKYAKDTCEGIGGHQAWIDGPKEEALVIKFVVAYRRYIRNPGRYIWLPSIVGKGRLANWTDSGKDARYILTVNDLDPFDFSGDSNGRQLFIDVYGKIHACTGCARNRKLQALCETDMVAKVRRKPKGSRKKGNKVRKKPKGSRKKGKGCKCKG